MAVITQEYLNERVYELNQWMKHTNPLELDLIPQEGVVSLRSRRDFGEEERGSIKGHAVCDTKSGNIYFIYEELEKQIDEFKSHIDPMFEKTMKNVYKDIPRFLITESLMHENIHRNCKSIPLPEELSDTYIQFCESAIPDFSKNRIYNAGLRLEQKVESGYRLFPKGMDECVVNWMTGDTMSPFYGKKGMLPNDKIGKLINFFQHYGTDNEEMHAFAALFTFSKESERYKTFISDFLAGSIPHKTYDKLEKVGTLESGIGLFTAFHVMGDIKGIPILLSEVYEHGEKVEYESFMQSL